MNKIKITTIVGTRPEIIRLSEITKMFDEVFQHRLIYTGQNIDPNLSKVFFEDLNLRNPDLEINTNNESVGRFLSELFENIEIELTLNRPDGVVVLGDTNSALSVIMAKKLKIPVYHLEAGNRSFDMNVPEEINRKIIDHTSDFNLAYTEFARTNLLREGLHPRNIAVIGSPLREIINKNLKNILNSSISEKLKLQKEKFILVSIHRHENLNIPARFQDIIRTLDEVSEYLNLPILVSTHPHTRKILNKVETKSENEIIFHDPFNFTDYVKLQMDALLVISDSGTISEESAILNFKAVTLRNSMERPEALDAGSIVLTGIKSNNVLEAIKIVLNTPTATNIPDAYKIEDCSIRTTKFILSTINEYKFWNSLY